MRNGVILPVALTALGLSEDYAKPLQEIKAHLRRRQAKRRRQKGLMPCFRRWHISRRRYREFSLGIRSTPSIFQWPNCREIEVHPEPQDFRGYDPLGDFRKDVSSLPNRY